MNQLTKKRILISSIFFIMNAFTIHAYASISNLNSPQLTSIELMKGKENKPCKGGNCNDDELADKCRELALKIDWLSRYQDRPACTQNLDGTSVYFAGHYLDKDRKNDAEELLEEAMVKVNFALEIGCYGQDDIKKLIADIKVLLKALNA